MWVSRWPVQGLDRGSPCGPVGGSGRGGRWDGGRGRVAPRSLAAGTDPELGLSVPEDLHEVVHRHVEAPQVMVLVQAVVQEFELLELVRLIVYASGQE